MLRVFLHVYLPLPQNLLLKNRGLVTTHGSLGKSFFRLSRRLSQAWPGLSKVRKV
jgi:hypothetical protein